MPSGTWFSRDPSTPAYPGCRDVERRFVEAVADVPHWLRWIAAELSRASGLLDLPTEGMRVRAIDSTSISGPNSKELTGVHYTSICHDGLRLHELLMPRGEGLERAPVQRGDVVSAIATSPVSQVCARDCRVGTSSSECAESAPDGRQGRSRLPSLRGCDRTTRYVYQRGVRLLGKDVRPASGTRHRGPTSSSSRQESSGSNPLANRRKGKKTNPKTLEAAKYIFIFTTLPERMLSRRWFSSSTDFAGRSSWRSSA